MTRPADLTWELIGTPEGWQGPTYSANDGDYLVSAYNGRWRGFVFRWDADPWPHGPKKRFRHILIESGSKQSAMDECEAHWRRQL